MSYEVALQDLHKGPVELKLRVVGVALVDPRRIEPPFHPEQQRRQEVALQLDAAGIRGPLRLLGQGVDERLQPWNVRGRNRDLVEQAAAGQPRGVRDRITAEQLFAEPQHGTAEITGALEHMHLTSPDQRDLVRFNERNLSVDEVLRCALARPDQLVVVVAVRTGRPALVVRVKGSVVEKQNLQRGAGLRQAIEDDFAEPTFLLSGKPFESGPLSGDGVRAAVAEGSSERRANREEPLPGTVDRAR